MSADKERQRPERLRRSRELRRLAEEVIRWLLSGAHEEDRPEYVAEPLKQCTAASYTYDALGRITSSTA